jgi:hypothetical protein
MHSNLWATFYLTLVPTGFFLFIGVILWVTKKRFAKAFLFIGLALLFFPIVFIVGHFNSVGREMNLRAGTYIVTRQENTSSLCGDMTFDSLKLTLNKDGRFYFNYKPCFTDKLSGQWKWYEDLVTTGTTFDKINDSLYLYFPTDDIIDTIVLTKYQTSYLTFSKLTYDK